MFNKPTTKREAYHQILDYILDISEKKNTDYGASNIGVTGLTGIGVRLIDKSMRIYNLANNEAQVKDEKIDDTLIDTANYAMIGLLLKHGYWELPWNEDK